MSQTLIGLMLKKIEMEGPSARLKLALSIERGGQMIDRYLKGTSVPRPEQGRTLAKECKANEREVRAVEEELTAHLNKAMKAVG